jgi:DNA-binding PadR family transcriptional regulator
MTSHLPTHRGRVRHSPANDNELVLLGLLSGSAMHGYQLNEVIEQRLPLLSRIKPSTAYSRLDRLAARGLVEATIERVGRRPERKVYALTEAGRERFMLLLRENLRSAALPSPSGDLGLLFHRALPGEEVAMLLAERRDETAARRPQVEDMLARHMPGSAGRLIAEHTLVHLDAELAWLDALLERGFEGTH